MAGYNRTRHVEDLLERTESSPPSFAVHLHPEYWTLNNGSKFLYNNQIASLLDDIRAHRIPVDFLDLFESARVPFYDGCMIVELLDYRLQKNKEPALENPERTRAVLHPNSETLWADICSLNQRHGGKWTDHDALEVEALTLLATAPPLCLDPDPHLTRIANHVLRVSTPTVPVSLKRKAAALDPEEDETDKARRSKIMHFMNHKANRTYTPSYRILDVLHNARNPKPEQPVSSAPTPNNQSMVSNHQSPAQPSTPAQGFSHASPTTADDTSQKVKQQSPATFARAIGSQTPIPPQPTLQFVNTHQQNTTAKASPTSAQSPIQPQVYASVQAATEAAKRASTPAQQLHYAPSPRPTVQPPLPVAQPLPQSQAPAQQRPTSAFQPQVPNQHFLHPPPPPGVRNGTNKPSTSNAAQPTTQQVLHAQQMYAQQQASLLHQQLARQKNGRSTPQGLPAQASSPATRGSPIVSNQPLAARSPAMPPNSQLRSPMAANSQLRSPMPPPAQQPQQPMASHPPPHPNHIGFTPTYNPGHLRPVIHGNPHPQGLPAHLTNAATGAQASPSPHPPTASDGQAQQPQPPQQQTIPHPYSAQMYQYAQMNYMPQRMPVQAYWAAGMGRGIPGLVNGQQVPGMVPGAQQQVPLQKAVPGGGPSGR